jgi:hypothetical protein
MSQELISDRKYTSTIAENKSTTENSKNTEETIFFILRC